MMQFQDVFWGPNGFEELRKYVKQGNDFCKEINSILHERAELETHYAKCLTKLSLKVTKVTKDTLGTTCRAWQEVASQMEREAELHRNMSSGLNEDVIRPLKCLVDKHHKTRKMIESAVDKTSRNLSDRRTEEQKAKKINYSSTKDNERLQDLTIDNLRTSRNKVITDKDINKLENKKRKAEETLVRTDLDYYSACLRAERSRQDWESTVFKSSDEFQRLEEERLAILQDLIQKYYNHLNTMGPKMLENCEAMNSAIAQIDIYGDIQTVAQFKGTGRNMPEQLLPDFFAENLNNSMKKERRKDSLEKFLKLIKHDLELERKGKQGVETLARVLQETPTFGDQDSQHDVNDKLQHMRSMLAYLEATRHKVHCSLADLEGKNRPNHPLSSHLEQYKDKNCIAHSILKVPHWVQLERRNSDSNSSLSSETDHTLPDYSMDGGESIYANLEPTVCKALYNYTARVVDELSFQEGDIISIIERSTEDWWKGELNHIHGYFPSSYVAELSDPN